MTSAVNAGIAATFERGIVTSASLMVRQAAAAAGAAYGESHPRLADELGVPLRDRDIRYEGGFYGQNGKGESFPEAIGVGVLVELLRRLSPGVTELGCHPGMEMAGESTFAELGR